MVMTAPEAPLGAPRGPSEPSLTLPPLLRHKVAPPPPEPTTLARPRLLRALDAAAGRRLTIIAAPAGYGKTTLLATWAAAHAARPGSPPLAWLSLAPEADDPPILAGLITAALEQTGLAPTWPLPPRCEDEDRGRTILVWALNSVAAAGGPLTLVLDGYEALRSAAAHELVALLVEHAPPGLRLIIAGRGEPALPLARLRARRQLAELRADDLRLSVAEAALYLNDRLGLALGPDTIAELVARTEGWIAGLSLAALALEGRRGAPAPAAHRFVADYLLGEVLEREPEAARRFLLETALLDELSGPAVEALLLPEAGAADRPALLGGYPSGLAALEALERRGVFLQTVEGGPGRYRYHGLFAETLRAHLRLQHPQRAAELAGRLAGASARAPRAEAPSTFGLVEPLSERERETLALIAAGRLNREVADLLKISESTVKSHLKHIFAKLNARNRTEAVAIARDLHILEL